MVDPRGTISRDATLADVRAGNILVLMMQWHRRGDHRSATRCRQHLRRRGLSVTLGKLDPFVQPGQLGFELDRLVEAMRKGDFRLAGSYRKSLLKSGVAVVPLAAKAEGRPR